MSHQSVEIQWWQIFLAGLILWNEGGNSFKKIMQPNYTEGKKLVFYSNATEFRIILKNLNFTNEVLNFVGTKMEVKVIRVILLSPRIKQKELTEQVKVSVSTIQRTIRKLVKEYKIVQMNGKRDSHS